MFWKRFEEMVEFLLDIQEIRRPESIFKLTAHWWSSIKDLKDKIFALTREPPSRQHIYHSTNPVELHNSQILHDLGIEKSGRMLRVAIDYRCRSQFTLTPTKGVLMDDACRDMLRKVRLGLQRNMKPKSTDEFEGSGGVYFLKSVSGAYEAVFKPHDEEQGMPANPKDHVGAGKEGLREFFLPGQGCLRELAAYIMDEGGFCRVPATTLVHCEHESFHYPSLKSKVGTGTPYPKLGSLQRFIHGAELFEDLGPGLFSDLEVQKIALLDIRILNCDRNAANILVKRAPVHELYGRARAASYDDDHITFTSSSSDSDEYDGNGRLSPDDASKSSSASAYELYPIDHGYSMPSHLKIFEWDWAWLHYPQVNRPVAPEIVKYMESLDIDDLLRKLEPQVPLSDDSVFLLRLSHFLLLNGIRAGLTLKEIAMTIVRSDEDVPSKLEQSIAEAEENAYRSIELKSSSRVKGSSSRLSQQSSSNSNSANSSPRSTAEVANKNKDFAEISLNALRKDSCLKCSNEGAGGHSNSSSGDEYTTVETDSASSDRLSPSATGQCSHAVNLSPMRPNLSCSSSWNSFASFHAPQPSLSSYANSLSEPSQSDSLGTSSHSKQKLESKYLPNHDSGSPESKNESISLMSGYCESPPSFQRRMNARFEENKLGTIVEYARERGLSSMSNGSRCSDELPDQCGSSSAPLSTVLSCDSVQDDCCGATGKTEEKEGSSAVSGLTTATSEESLQSISVGLSAISVEDDEKHKSLPANALRRMNAVIGYSGFSGGHSSGNDSSLFPSSRDVKEVKVAPNTTTTGNLSSEDGSEVHGVHVDVSVPNMLRHQRSIDSSLDPNAYARAKWAASEPSRSVNLTKAALSGSFRSHLGLDQSPRHLSSNSLCSSNSGNGENDYGEYGFFNFVKEDTSVGEKTPPLQCGEFSGIDLSTKKGTSPSDDFDDLCSPVPLTRVVSFSGFESAPTYSNLFAGNMGNLRLERRKTISKTKEFMQLRLQFVKEHVSSTIHRIKKDKGKQ